MPISYEAYRLTEPANCCGPSVCDCMSFDRFMESIQKLYPGPDGDMAIVKRDGVFNGVIRALSAPIYNLYVSNCGACNLPREMNPCTSCCTTDCWIEEYGLPDDCYSDELFNPCWLTGSERGIALKAQLCARVFIEWNNHLDYGFFEQIGSVLGITFKISSPTIVDDLGELCIDDIELDWPDTFEDGPQSTQTRTRNADGSITTCVTNTNGETTMVNVASSGDYRCVMPKLTFTITGAPASLYSTICSPLDQPFCWNPYVDSFKCLVQQYLPCHYQVRFCEEITSTNRPQYDDNCPDDCGRYKGSELTGSGTSEDPFQVDFTQLSEAQVIALAKRIAAKGAC